MATLIRQIRSIWTFPLSPSSYWKIGFLQFPPVYGNLGYWVLQYILSFKTRPIGRIDLTCWTVVRNLKVLQVHAESEEHGLRDQHFGFQVLRKESFHSPSNTPDFRLTRIISATINPVGCQDSREHTGE